MTYTPTPSGPPEGIERRKNHRLRKLIDDLQAGLHSNTEAIDQLRGHVSELLHDVDSLKRVMAETLE